MLRAENLSLTVPGKTLVQNLNVEFKPGEFWAVLGKNGSGKTTLLNTLSGVTKIENGKVELNQQALQTIKPQQRAKQIGLLLQKEDSSFFGTAESYVLLGRFPYGDSDKDVASKARKVDSLSGGEFQRARIAQLFCQSPQIYCLDEPLMHLDVAHQYAVMKQLGELATKQAKTVIIAMHEPQWTWRYCSRALLLFDKGEYLTGTAADMLTAERLQKLYGCDREALAGFGML
jgi:iron complex transport system ATP-binding protein